MAGKNFVLLMVYGDQNDVDSGANNLINIIKQTASYTGAKLVQTYSFSTGGMSPNIFSTNKDAQKAVYDLGKSLLRC